MGTNIFMGHGTVLWCQKVGHSWCAPHLNIYTEHSHGVSVVHCYLDFNKMNRMTYYLFLFRSWN